MTNPLVSCIIPVFNGERFLAEAIQSILGQTYKNLEVIVVDDGSTDGTADVVAGFGDAVTYVRQENAGPSTARNRGIQEAHGEFIAFLDADDVWHAEKLEKQLARFRERPELAYTVTWIQNFWEEEVRDEAIQFKDHPRSRPVPGYTTQTLVVRREWLDKTGGLDASMAHGDAANWFQRADAAGAVSDVLQEVLTRRRLHLQNRSRLRADNSREAFLKVLKDRLDRQRGSTP
jgi:glycosyltransferase involved in cell wall biosynthesis